MHRLAVVGVGTMGGHHARIIHGLEGAELAAVYDNDKARAVNLAQMYNSVALENITDIEPEDIDGVIIAVPSRLHAEIGQNLLQKGLNILVEKPLSLDIAEAESLKDAGVEADKVVMVGHTELFNPAVREMNMIIGATAIRSMRFSRLGAVSNETRLYHNVVHDLMIHDIAVALKLLDKTENDATVLAAVGRSETPAVPDPAEAYVRFGSGEDVVFRASRAYSGGKIRTLEVETEQYVMEADLLEYKVIRRSAGEGRFIVGEAVFTQDVSIATYYPQKTAEPLALELMHFVKCIEGSSTPEAEFVSAADGVRVMKIAEAILNSMKS